MRDGADEEFEQLGGETADDTYRQGKQNHEIPLLDVPLAPSHYL